MTKKVKSKGRVGDSRWSLISKNNQRVSGCKNERSSAIEGKTKKGMDWWATIEKAKNK